MKIQIKRATTEGLKDAEGDLFNANGYQFCLVKADGLFFAIELTTGCSVKAVDADNYSKSEALKIAKAEINKRTKSEFEAAMSKIKSEYCKRYKFSVPVNEPVSNGL